MKVRVITAIVMGIVLAPAVIFSGTYVYAVMLAFLCGMGIFEMLRCIGIHKNLFVSVPCIMLGIALPLYAKYVPQQAFLMTAVMSIVLLLWLFSVSLFSHGSLPIDTAGMAYFALVYIICGFTFMVLLRQMEHGVYLYLLPFVGAWVSDSFAYFTGRLIGRHKLIPDVSPKKTVEGAVGGVVFAMLSFVLYGFLAKVLGGAENPRYIALLLLGLPVSLISIIGDLVMSLIKRRYAIKDYSKLLPGHGGVLDRFDSVLATTIVLYLLCANTTFFGLLF